MFVSLQSEKDKNMCTVSLTYDQSNALARRKLAELLKTGLFAKVYTEPTVVQEADDEEKAHRQEVEEFIYASKIMAARAFADKL